MRQLDVAGAAHLVVVSGAPLLRPDAQVFEAMLEGWTNQQMARNLGVATIRARAELVRRFADHAGEFPWQWAPAHLEEWSTDLRAVRGLAQSSVRGYQTAIRLFCVYAADLVYGSDRECEARFGSHPVQICHDWNTAVHRSAVEGQPARRALTRVELQLLFDTADEMVDEIRRHGRKGYATAYRDATLLKVAYAWGAATP
jgi:integrase/recombinase XerC